MSYYTILYLTLESPPKAPKPKTTSKGTKRKSSPSSSEKAKSSKKAKAKAVSSSSSSSEAESEKEDEDELKDELKALAEEAAEHPTEQVKGKKRRSQQEKDALPKKTPKTKAKAAKAEATEATEELETKIEVDKTSEKESEASAAKVNLFSKKGQEKKTPKEKAAAKSTKKSSPKSAAKKATKSEEISPEKPDEKSEKTPEKSPKKSPEKEKSPAKAKSPEKTPKAKLNPFAAMMGKSPAGQSTESAKSSSFEETVKKARYDPIEDAIWKRSAKTPYLAFAKTLQAIEATSGRLKTIEILSNYFRSVIVLSPDDLLPSVYMCLNRIAPAYEGKELGIGETLLMKAIAQTTGRSVAQIKADVGKKG